MSQSDFQTMLGEPTDAKNSLMQHNGYVPRQLVFGLIPRVPGHMHEENATSVGWRPSRQRRMRRSEREMTCLEIWCTGEGLACIEHTVAGTGSGHRN